MVRKVEVVTNWGVQFLGVDSRSVTVETLFKRVLGLTYVLHSAQPAREDYEQKPDSEELNHPPPKVP